MIFMPVRPSLLPSKYSVQDLFTTAASFPSLEREVGAQLVIPAICDLEKERGLKMEEEGREGAGGSIIVGRQDV